MNAILSDELRDRAKAVIARIHSEQEADPLTHRNYHGNQS
jgi:hypothetical protein